MKTEQLPHVIEGRGSVKGWVFQRMAKTDDCYIYRARKVTEDGLIVDKFDVFKRNTVEGFDFDTKERTGEHKEKYPSDEQFGITAWQLYTMHDAYNKLSEIVIKYDKK